jgi:coenzyme F420 hydrogenase subunit beta
LHERVIRSGLCARCGICAGVCPVLVIGFNERNFPVLSGECTDCGLCTMCCPGAEVALPHLVRRLFAAEYDPENLQGHVDGMFVAHSTVDRIRDSATSGGVVTGLLVHLLQQGEIDGAVVVAPDPEQPYRFKGSSCRHRRGDSGRGPVKVLPDSLHGGLNVIRKRKGRFAVVGLPCQVQGLSKLEEADPSLARKIYCIFGLYCHCNMEPYTHLEVLESLRNTEGGCRRFRIPGRGLARRVPGHRQGG